MCTLQSELAQWRTLFIFTACIHLISALCFVLLAACRRHPPPQLHSRSPVPPTDFEAPPTGYEVPPTTAKPAVARHTSSGRSGAPPSGDDDNRSAVDSDTEYRSVDESMEHVSDSAEVTSPGSRSFNADRDLHLGQLMESIL